MAAEIDHHHSGTPDVTHEATEHERPEQWGWHHEFSKGRQIAGWLSILVLALLMTSTHYNGAGILATLIIIGVLAAGLIWDRQRRRTQWRQ